MPTHDIIVIGGSAGALGGLKRILQSLPPGFPAAILVVVHTAADSAGILPAILSKTGPLPAFAALDGAPVRLGAIHVAPPDHHLLVQPAKIRVTAGPRENQFRPAVDPLFRTAAASYGPRVIGVTALRALEESSALRPRMAAHARERGMTVIADSHAMESQMRAKAVRRVLVTDTAGGHSELRSRLASASED